MRNLEDLDAGNNKLSSFPDSCEEMKRIRRINLERNGLQTLPTSLLRDTPVEIIKCDGESVESDTHSAKIIRFGACSSPQIHTLVHRHLALTDQCNTRQVLHRLIKTFTDSGHEGQRMRPIFPLRDKAAMIST